MNSGIREIRLPAEENKRQESFVLLFVRHQRRIRAFISTLVPDPSDTDEVLQETSVVAWRKYDQIACSADFSEATFIKWVCTIARYEALSYLRQRKRDRLQFSESLIIDLAERQLCRSEGLEARHRALLSCIKKLRPQDRELVRECYCPDTSIKQAAADLQRPVNTVYKALSRIRNALLQCVERSLKTEGL